MFHAPVFSLRCPQGPNFFVFFLANAPMPQFPVMEFPEMAWVRQDVFRSTVADPLETVRACFDALPDRLSGNGKTVAVCVGSRRIDRLDLVVDACQIGRAHV